MQSDQGPTNHLPRPQSLGTMSALGWFAVVPEMVAIESRRGVRPDGPETEAGALWRYFRGFARRLLSAPGRPRAGNGIARQSSGYCRPQVHPTSVSLVIGAEENLSPAPKNPQAACDKFVSRLGFLHFQRVIRGPTSVSCASKSNLVAKGRFGRRQQDRIFTDREE